MGLFDKVFGSYSSRELKKITSMTDEVLALEDEYKNMSEETLKGKTAHFKERYKKGESLDRLLPEAFATIKEATRRVIDQPHYPVQITGGIILHQGRIAEMKTGEGKTQVAILPAYLNALSGKGVHIVTVNDYLAKRDSEWMGKIYKYLGLSVGLIVNGLDSAQRREAYAADITYGTNNEFGFDYLRDNMVIYKEEQVQRGHSFAIVDEVDSILVDEARTPLIISGPGEKSTDLYARVDKFAKTLRPIKVKEMDTKADNDELDGDYIVDEKAKTASLTRAGVEKAERHFHIENLTDPDNMTLQHHINQAIKAHGVMTRDIDYVVNDGEVLIVDEFTGRLMIGRRYSDGLHQAIEAKEGVKVERENKTLATITFQNYFRMYDKLSGMTGTAMTESAEFQEIYALDVVEIPTNKPNQRIDHQDVIYKTEPAKFDAVIEEIVERHETGQPILVGTISIEKSELLSKMLKKRGVKHQVLNAKQHEREAEIVAQAGKKGAVTIATNMAGRGTDIKLGGNDEFMANDEMRKEGYTEDQIAEASSFSETDDQEILEIRTRYTELIDKHKRQIAPEAEEVKSLGGLCIMGTERHESRRIDNQLRGRCARQGDPGETVFYLSLEDDLMRLFAGERVSMLMDTMKIDDDVPLTAKMLTGTIESAQKRVEARNFSIRKSVLEYDDVMNVQRTTIYAQRTKVLNGEDVSDYIKGMMEESIRDTIPLFLSDDTVKDEWNLAGLRDHYLGWLTNDDDLRYNEAELTDLEPADVSTLLIDRAKKIYREKEERYGEETMREVERVILLRVVDSKWMDHIDQMDQLKQGIYLRSYGQRDPVVEYRIEGFDMFDEMVESIKEDTLKHLMVFELKTEEELKREQQARVQSAKLAGGDDSLGKKPVVKQKKVGRNDPCPCGSGKKYKKCCGATGADASE